MDISKSIKITQLKNAFKLIFKNPIFIVFSFINLFIPLYATMISSLNQPNGAYDLIGVGLTTSFISIFNQFLFLLSMIIFYVMNRNKTHSMFEINEIKIIWGIIFIYAFISAALFIACSFLYINFSSIYNNLKLSVEAGFNFSALVMPSLFINAYIYIYITKANTKSSLISNLSILGFFALNIIFIPVIGVLPNWGDTKGTIGIGLGLLSSSIIMLSIIIVVDLAHIHFFNMRFSWEKFKYFLNKTKNFCLSFLLSTILKSFLVMAIALSLGLAQKDTPPALMIAKIIWYNSLFFCGFFADGLMYSIQFARLKHNNLDSKPHYTIWNSLIFVSFIVTLIICVIFNFAAMELAKLYVANQTADMLNPLPMWPYGQLSYQEIQDYLWSPTTGVYNFKLIQITSTGIEYSRSPAYALMYLTIYHVIIAVTKIMGISEIKINQKFNVKALVSNFILISLVMIFIVSFSVGGADNETIYTKFPGVDAFSFSLVIIIAFLFILTLLGYLKAMINSKKGLHHDSEVFEIN